MFVCYVIEEISKGRFYDTIHVAPQVSVITPIIFIVGVVILDEQRTLLLDDDVYGFKLRLVARELQNGD